MANTANVSLSSNWTKVVNSTSADFLASNHSAGPLEFAVTSADVTPTIKQGHILKTGDGLNRSVIGSGYLWARIGGNYPSEVVLTITQ